MSDSAKQSVSQRIGSAIRLSSAAYVSLTIGLALIVVTFSTWLVYGSDPQRVAWGDYMHWPQQLMLTVLIGAICGLAYWTVRLWSEDLPVIDETLDRAWQAGASAIAQRGWKMDQLPLFLVLGCEDEASQKQLIEQSGCQIMIDALPAWPSPLKWFVAEDRIFLFCSEAGVFGTTQSRLALFRESMKARVASLSRAHFDSVPCQDQPESLLRSLASPRSPVADDVRKRSATAPTQQMQFPLGNSVSAGTAIATKREYASTQVLPADTGPSAALRSLASAERWLAEIDQTCSCELQPSGALACDSTVQLLTSSEHVRLQSQLSDLCRLLRVARGHAAPLNGILAAIDTPKLVDCHPLAHECGRALRLDLLHLQEQLGIQAPVSMMLDRMQSIAGFSELVRRTGPERVNRELLGEGFSLRRNPNSVAVRALCRESLRNMAAAIYDSFRRDGIASQPGNHKLFQCLMTCRGRLAKSLAGFLIEAASSESPENNQCEPILLSGLFFAASGSQPIQRGFARGIFARMIGQQELLNWTKARQTGEHRYMIATRVLQLLCGTLSTAIIAQLLWFLE